MLLVISCGIEVFVYLYPVEYRTHTPSEDPVLNYFNFRTTDTTNTSGAGTYFKGFEIYYRIYTTESDMNSKKATINSYNTNNPSLAYNYLITTQKYRRMLTTDRTATPLIEGAAVNRMIAVRLLTSPTLPDPGLYIDGVLSGAPRRSVPEGVGSPASQFDVDEVEFDDNDVTGTAFDALPYKIYIHAYVLAYGYDESYKQLYSELFELGHITIEDD